MRRIINKDGGWVQTERKNGFICYLDSDGVWLKERYKSNGKISWRLDSFGQWTKFIYTKINNNIVVKQLNGKLGNC